MDITGEYRLDAPRQQVWDMLNDVNVLQQCIPGCESIEALGDNEFTAKVLAAIGPVKAKFNADIRLENLDPPNSYTIAGQAKSGPAGFGRGEANVTLTQDGDQTLLSYSAELKVGGKLAQIGSRMVVAATKKTADDFFSAFAELASPGSEKIEVPESSEEKPPKENNKVWLAIGGAIAVLLILLLLF